MTFFKPALVAALSLCATTATSHASLETQEAQANANYKAIVRIAHGCEGEPTLSVTVQIPAGVINVKPMPKANWELETVTTEYAKPYEYHGTRTEGVTEITWTGTLDDGHYDEFVFRGRITDDYADGDTLYFPVTQTCANGDHAWVEIPAEGQSRGDLAKPAPGVSITGGSHDHH